MKKLSMNTVKEVLRLKSEQSIQQKYETLGIASRSLNPTISRSGKAKTAESALQEGLIYRFGRLQKLEKPIMLRSDNGLVFSSRSFTKTVKAYKFEQEFITPYTPEQNGMIERFFRTIKEECIWHHNFKSIKEANDTITRWIGFYNRERRHSALQYKTPSEAFRIAA